MDKKKLQELIDAASEARLHFDATLRAIEHFVGTDLDGLEEIVDTCDADSLVEWAEEQGYDLSGAGEGPDNDRSEVEAE